MKFAAEIAFAVLLSAPLQAQIATLSGTVTGPAGAAVSNAKVTAKSPATAQPAETQTNSVGVYNLPNLAPGDYDVSVSAPGFDSKTAKVTLAAAASAAARLRFDRAVRRCRSPFLERPGFRRGAGPGQRPGTGAARQTVAHAKDAPAAWRHHHRSAGRDAARRRAAPAAVMARAAAATCMPRSGAVTAGMYLTTASFAIFAPKVPGTKTRGPIRIHKALAWIHGPGMILTPILGAMAYQQLNRGEQVHGIAKAHSTVAAITTVAYGAAISPCPSNSRQPMTRKPLLALWILRR